MVVHSFNPSTWGKAEGRGILSSKIHRATQRNSVWRKQNQTTTMTTTTTPPARWLSGQRCLLPSSSLGPVHRINPRKQKQCLARLSRKHVCACHGYLAFSSDSSIRFPPRFKILYLSDNSTSFSG